MDKGNAIEVQEKRMLPRSALPVLARSLLAVAIAALLLVGFTPASGEGFTRGINLLGLLFVTTAAVWLLTVLLMVAMAWVAWKARSWRVLWPQHRFALMCLLGGVWYPLICVLLLRLKA